MTLKWEEPENNGAVILQYSIYQRIANDERWTNLKNITVIPKREYVVTVKKGNKYQFLVTATNKYGESKKNGNNIKTVDLNGGTLLQMRIYIFIFREIFPDV